MHRRRPRPKKELLTQKSIALTNEQYRQLAAFAELDGYRSVSELIREAIEQWLKDRHAWEKGA